MNEEIRKEIDALMKIEGIRHNRESEKKMLS